jgi:hypothetical protein
MPSFADWMRADIIAALALCVSILAFVASAASSVVAWRSYNSSRAARLPKLRVYFEPFEDSAVWWIATFEITNRSDHALQLERLRIKKPWGASFSLYLGPYVGGAGGNEPMSYTLPVEVHTLPTKRTLTSQDLDEGFVEEYPPSEASQSRQVFVKIPISRIWKTVSFQVQMREHGHAPRNKTFSVKTLYPSKAMTKTRG